MPTSADLLLDTSAALALVREADPAHEAVRAAVQGRTIGLSGHALVETFSVLTRLPGEARVSASLAARIISSALPASVALPSEQFRQAAALFASAGIAGGAVYDGLVALAARTAGIPLLSCDRRATGTYAALQVEVRLI